MTYMRRCTQADRRQREFGPPYGMADRRMRAERRCLRVSEATFTEWAERAANFYYEHGSPERVERRSADRG